MRFVCVCVLVMKVVCGRAVWRLLLCQRADEELDGIHRHKHAHTQTHTHTVVCCSAVLPFPSVLTLPCLVLMKIVGSMNERPLLVDRYLLVLLSRLYESMRLLYVCPLHFTLLHFAVLCFVLISTWILDFGFGSFCVIPVWEIS